MRTQITMNDGTSWQEGELISQMITDIDGKPVTFDDLDEDGDGKITVDEYVLNTCRVHTCSFWLECFLCFPLLSLCEIIVAGLLNFTPLHWTMLRRTNGTACLTSLKEQLWRWDSWAVFDGSNMENIEGESRDDRDVSELHVASADSPSDCAQQQATSGKFTCQWNTMSCNARPTPKNERKEGSLHWRRCTREWKIQCRRLQDYC